MSPGRAGSEVAALAMKTVGRGDGFWRALLLADGAATLDESGTRNDFLRSGIEIQIRLDLTVV